MLTYIVVVIGKWEAYILKPNIDYIQCHLIVFFIRNKLRKYLQVVAGCMHAAYTTLLLKLTVNPPSDGYHKTMKRTKNAQAVFFSLSLSKV